MKRTLTAALALGLMACGGDESQSGAPTVTPPSNGGLAGSIAPSVTPPTTSTPIHSGAAGASSTTPPAPNGKPSEPAPTATGTQYCSVRKVLDSRCTACHNEQKVAGAPMSLKTYKDLQLPAVSDKTKKVFQVVGVRVHDTVKPMPPQEKLTADQLNSIDT